MPTVNGKKYPYTAAGKAAAKAAAKAAPAAKKAPTKPEEYSPATKARIKRMQEERRDQEMLQKAGKAYREASMIVPSKKKNNATKKR